MLTYSCLSHYCEKAYENIQDLLKIEARTRVIAQKFGVDDGYTNELKVALTEWHPEHH